MEPCGAKLHAIPVHRTERIPRFAGHKRVEAPRTHHVPRRHLAAVLVALVAVGLVAVHGLEDLANPLVPFVGAFRGRVQPGNVVGGFVAVGILANQTSNVCLFAPDGGRRSRKERVQLAFKAASLSSEHPLPASQIVHRSKAILPCVGLRVVAVYLARLKALHKIAVVARTH